MWNLDRTSDPPLWRFSASDHVSLAFTTRCGGVSAPPYDTLNLGRSTADPEHAVDENRRRVLTALDLDVARLATAGQVHGTEVAAVRSPGLHRQVDALLTRERGIALAITCADCLPLIFVTHETVAVAHSGWRGTASRMPIAALQAVGRAANVSPAHVEVHIGPSIRGCCYEVGPTVAHHFEPPSLTRRDGSWFLDLAVAAHAQLVAHGVPEHNVHVMPACTACHPDLYFSHRRDAGRTGRMWAVAALR